MNGDPKQRQLGDDVAHLKEAGNRLVPEVVKVQIVYAQNLAGACEKWASADAASYQ